MAIGNSSVQYFYTGRNPLDAKALVQNYAALTNPNTWLNDNNETAAYNGMLTAVWLDKVNSALSDRNGIYMLFDPEVTSTRGSSAIPDVTKESNWHKICELSELEAFKTQVTNTIDSLSSRIDALEQDNDVITFGYRSGFPAIGEVNKLYIAADEGKSYVWFNDAYLPVSGGGDYEEPEVIYGGDSGI